MLAFDLGRTHPSPDYPRLTREVLVSRLPAMRPATSMAWCYSLVYVFLVQIGRGLVNADFREPPVHHWVRQKRDKTKNMIWR
jgi:hypothetical protein